MLDKKATFFSLIHLWILVILGNLIGVTVSVILLVAVDDIVQAYEGYITIAEHLVDVDFIPLFISALLAGWLMALGSWISLATHNVSGKVILIYLVTFLIGLGGLYHSSPVVWRC